MLFEPNYGIEMLCVALYGRVWPFMAVYGLILPFLTVIDPNSFGLVSFKFLLK